VREQEREERRALFVGHADDARSVGDVDVQRLAAGLGVGAEGGALLLMPTRPSSRRFVVGDSASYPAYWLANSVSPP
jgi:hypothetical protein